MTEEQRKEMEEKLKNMSPEELREFQKQQCIFCQIISGKIPSKKVYEDKHCLAILDINPAAKGHILLLPKEHYAIMPQMPDKELGHMYTVAKKISQALLKGLKVSGTNLFVANGLPAGQKAQHFILHIIPRKDGDGLLEVSERLVNKEMRTKVYDLIETKFNEIMGIKKKAIPVQKTLPEEDEVDRVEETEINEEEMSKDSEDAEEKIIEKTKKEGKVKPKKKTKEKPIKESSEEDKKSKDDENNGDDDEDTEEHHNKSREEVDASLDDIANLFK